VTGLPHYITPVQTPLPFSYESTGWKLCTGTLESLPWWPDHSDFSFISLKCESEKKPIEGDSLMVDPSEVFFGYLKYFGSLGLDNEVSYNTWSQRSLWFFDSLGRMLGYNVVTEDAFISSDQTIDPKLIGKRTDLTWLRDDKYFLALEYQRSSDMETIKSDIQKLVVYPNLRVLIVFRRNLNTQNVRTTIQKAIGKDLIKGSRFLLIILPNWFKQEPEFEEAEGVLFGYNGEILNLGKARAFQEKTSGLCMFTAITWEKPG